MNEVEELLPLTRSLLHVLLALHEGERHGYAIKKHVEARSKGIVRMGPGTLYTTIQKAEDAGLIEESDERPSPSEDHAQRRYYDLTVLGRRVLRTEVERIGTLMDAARVSLADGGSG